MAAFDEVAVPTQHRVGAYEQPYTSQDVRWQPVQQRRQERPIARREPDLFFAELAFQHRRSIANAFSLCMGLP
ncbi:hypothetical protein [Streptomyces botrytidirepellens]|uniref:hypothetical protein n=1 Tax=Streptomyces botrytidirepellens TaxID=2486417 RepID=UPI001C839B90|nr:hypothetical protein [Streptomyces botrytidirepellens]